MSQQSHPQYQFLKEAGMTHDEILTYISQNLGLRNRTKERQTKANVPPVPTKAKVAKPQPAKEKKKLPQDLNQFKREYLQFMKGSRSKMDNEWRFSNIRMLFDFIKKLVGQKGIVSVLSHGKLKKVAQQLKKEYLAFTNYSQKQLLEVYLQNLLEYEYFLNGDPLQIVKGVDLSRSLSQALFMKGKLLQIVKSPSRGVQMYKEQIIVFRKGVDDLGIKYQDINLEKMQRSCGDQEIEVRIQHPMDYGFNVARLTNIVHHMTVKEYCEYQKNYKISDYKKEKFGEQLKNGKIFFGVNFQPEDLSNFQELWSKIDNSFLGFRQEFDLLSYLDSDIPGCSSPQFYMKVKGCWTGGHQQNIAMCAVNINHGPEESQWFTIPFCEVQKIRKVLLERFDCDLYLHEGLWYEKINWFIENGYPIKRIVQRKGDIVITGPGTLHWVRSFGVALQSAWNIFPKTYTSFQCALHRLQQNIAVGFEKPSIIPFKSLLLKLLDHELTTMDGKMLGLVILSIQQWLSQQQRLRLQLGDSCELGIENEIEFMLGDLESVCQICKFEVFNYYVQSWTGKGIACLKCLANNVVIQKASSLKLYYKYNNFHLKQLLHHAQSPDKKWTLGKFCNRPHIGKVKCSTNYEERKRVRQKTPSCDHTEDGPIEQSINYHSNIKNVIELSEKLPYDNNETIAQIAAKNNIVLTENVKSVSVATQTDKMTCPHCNHEANSDQGLTKKHCPNPQPPSKEKSRQQVQIKLNKEKDAQRHSHHLQEGKEANGHQRQTKQYNKSNHVRERSRQQTESHHHRHNGEERHRKQERSYRQDRSYKHNGDNRHQNYKQSIEFRHYNNDYSRDHSQQHRRNGNRNHQNGSNHYRQNRNNNYQSNERRNYKKDDNYNHQSDTRKEKRDEGKVENREEDQGY